MSRCAALALLVPIACSAAPRPRPEVPMPPVHDVPRFTASPLSPLPGGDGEVVTAWGGRVATLGASRATLFEGGAARTVPLPAIPVLGARFAGDGQALLAGPGVIDLGRLVYTAHPAFAALTRPPPPGGGGLALRAVSWSGDRRHAAALLAWSGPRPAGGAAPSRVVLLALDAGTSVDLPTEQPSAVRVVGDRVVVAGDTVRVFDLAGRQVAALPPVPGPPLSLPGGEGPLQPVLDADGSLRLLDARDGVVRGRWAGEFVDAVALPQGVLAIEQGGRLRAACLAGGQLEEAGAVDTGVEAAHLAATGDGRLVLVGAGPVPVQELRFTLRCPAAP